MQLIAAVGNSHLPRVLWSHGEEGCLLRCQRERPEPSGAPTHPCPQAIGASGRGGRSVGMPTHPRRPLHRHVLGLGASCKQLGLFNLARPTQLKPKRTDAPHPRHRLHVRDHEPSARVGPTANGPWAIH